METRNLSISKEEAKAWYYSGDENLKKLALRAFGEAEFFPSEIDLAVGVTSTIVGMRMPKSMLMKNVINNKLAIIAEYFNSLHPEVPEVKYFFGDKVTPAKELIPGTGIGVRKHNSVQYPGIVYFNREEDLVTAFKMMGANKILTLFR